MRVRLRPDPFFLASRRRSRRFLSIFWGSIAICGVLAGRCLFIPLRRIHNLKERAFGRILSRQRWQFCRPSLAKIKTNEGIWAAMRAGADKSTDVSASLTARGGQMTQPMAAGRPGQNGGDDGQNGTAVITRAKAVTKKPPLYRVLLLNDDFTPMEFVVHVLQNFFNKSYEDAYRIMMHVHQNGVGECGVFTYEVAETKVTLVMDFARQHQHPLQCVMEKS